MRSKSIASLIFLVAAFLFAFRSNAQGVASQFNVVFVRVDASGLGYVEFTNNLKGTPPSCVSGYPAALAFDTNTAGGKAILSVALSAQASGKKVVAVGTGACAVYGVMEQWNYGYVQTN